MHCLNAKVKCLICNSRRLYQHYHCLTIIIIITIITHQWLTFTGLFPGVKHCVNCFVRTIVNQLIIVSLTAPGGQLPEMQRISIMKHMCILVARQVGNVKIIKFQNVYWWIFMLGDAVVSFLYVLWQWCLNKFCLDYFLSEGEWERPVACRNLFGGT